MAGILYIVATPIGNLEDITLRALRTLKEADAIACEDTRVSGKLLKHYEIKKTLIALHEHSADKIVERIAGEIKQGRSIAYISDAGTPGVNDPGGKLVAACVQHGIKIEPIPGPSALTTAISVCGFAMDDFVYLGFAPHKKGRQTFFQEVAAREIPTVFFESTHRIGKAMESLAATLPKDRQIFIGRELTKMHETLYRGTVDEAAKQLQATSSKGEFVIIVGPA
ncbi:16S rRNA (cytidine(1402)-2'-O)-methyltransferase [Candidatus Uhrbacteria bacterium]|nr:MAG: 16S rRNA (cytidine(1402)-2'-O)-methyltransferase [Candidatus Uhrbacteria bacterium]